MSRTNSRGRGHGVDIMRWNAAGTASMVIAARENGFSRKQSQKAALAAVETYRTAMRAFASQSILTVWYAHLNIEDAVADYKATLSHAS